MQNIIALMLQKTADNIPCYKWTRITNMRMVIRRNTTDINISFTRMYRYKLFFLFRQCIVNSNRHSKLSSTE